MTAVLTASELSASHGAIEVLHQGTIIAKEGSDNHSNIELFSDIPKVIGFEGFVFFDS